MAQDTAGPAGAAAALESAKSALSTANSKFPSPAPPKVTQPGASYKHAAAARKSGGLSDLVNQASGEGAVPRHEEAVKQLHAE